MQISPDIFRNYDVRGEYPTMLNEEAAYLIGRAFVELKEANHVVVGCDMRESGESLKAALIKGILAQGAHVTDIGLTSTDGIYFASHYYERYDGAVAVTASHMPGKFNGFKFLDRNSQPIGKGSGMDQLSAIARSEDFQKPTQQGTLSTADIWEDYRKFVLSFIDLESLKPLKVVMDAGNGMGGFIAEKVYPGHPFEMVKMYFEPDGNFPNHGPNPLLPENRIDLENKVRAEKADLGVAWDADCDRVFFIDEKGNYVPADFITVLLGKHILAKHPEAGIVYDIRASHAVKDIIERAGGKAYAEKVGHTYIKHRMRLEDAEFGGEVSGHFYLKDNAYAENGFIIPLMMIEIISKMDKPLSEIVADLGEYHLSGEINSTVADPAEVIKGLAKKYANAEKIDYRDGITIEFADWHFNVRPSSNDPVIRLNLEANSDELMQEKRDEVLEFIRAH